ncbi:MAG: methyltransferase family protein [Caulobacteraceae bacterium]
MLVALAVLGFSLCWWARIHLGSLWSGWVSRKQDHRVIESGPYALVRHPIYSGVILAAAATAGLESRWTSLVGLALLIAGFWVKARIEERFLRSELGPQAYDAYAARTGMLIPFLR